MNHLWTVTETSFDPAALHHKETIFTIGNGYLSTRGAFEEGYAGERRATFIHGVFDDAPIVVTELANAPDWLPLAVYLDGERFSLASGTVEAYERTLDLRTGVLARAVRWRSPSGRAATLSFERFASLADPHLLLLRCRVTADFTGDIEIRAAINGYTDNDGLIHWQRLGQGKFDSSTGQLSAYLHCRTRHSAIEAAYAMRLAVAGSASARADYWDADNVPTLVWAAAVSPGQEIIADKVVGLFTSRDEPPGALVSAAVERAKSAAGWEAALADHTAAWQEEWRRTDAIVEGDDEAQIALRFNLFQMLIAAPRRDDRVSIGAKTLSGFGYRGHAFWDTEIFMLPLFTYTAPHIAKNLLNYRYRLLPAARANAESHGCRGAQFPWESADTGAEVTPAWVPHFNDRTQLVRIWTGDTEIHISADIAYAAYQYWRVTGDDEWLIERGAELILDTARFFACRAEWNEAAGRYEFNDVIGPDEYHEHVNNNAYTNRMAQWNIQTALDILGWLRGRAPERAAQLTAQLQLDAAALDGWREVAAKMYAPSAGSGLIEQFEGYFERADVDLAALEPRGRSAQVVFGIEGTNETQILKQPDVLMLLYLLREHYTERDLLVNYQYYTPRTDHTHGSSLGPAVQAIMACEVGQIDDAYEHFIRAARADLRDVRGNAGDGIHAASAAGTWQALVFGFGGLRLTPDGWRAAPRPPKHWRRLAFTFFYHGQSQQVEWVNPKPQIPLRAFIFDLDGVLTDTAEYHFRAWKQLADEEGIPFTREDNEQLRGVSRRESLLRLLHGRVYPEAEMQEMMARKNRYYLDFIREISERDVLPGARELLEEIRAAGLKTALGSASKNAGEVIDRLGLRPLLDAVADGNSVRRAKPAPDLFLHAASLLQLPAAECVVVEDAAAGIEAARAGGFRSVGLGPPERVGGADVVLPSLAGVRLAELLKALE